MIYNNYQLYFTVSYENADYYNEHGVSDVSAYLVAEDNIEHYASGVTHTFIGFDDVTKVTYSCNPNDRSRERVDLFTYSELESNDKTIIVWLGTENYVYQNSARIVSQRDLAILGKGTFAYKKPQSYKCFFWHSGSKCVYRNVNRKRNLKYYSKVKNSYNDYSEYNIPGKVRAKLKFNDMSDWDLFDDYSYERNWKSQTKARKQWAKHMK